MTTTSHQELTDAVTHALRRFRDMAARDITALSRQLTGDTRSRRRSNALIQVVERRRVLEHLVQAWLPEPGSGASLLPEADDGAPRQKPYPPGSRQDAKAVALKTAHAALKILANSDHFSIEEAVMRAFGYVCGPPVPDWEYICVNVSLDDASCVDIGGWQLASFDYATDPALPLTGAPGAAGDLLAPRVLHEMYGFGLIRRTLGSDPVPVDDDEPRVLVWPLLALNLALEAPVVAGPRYLVEPGRRVLASHMGWPEPAEVARWGYALVPGRPWRSHVIGHGHRSDVAAFCRAFLKSAARLDARRREQLARAADHFLFVTCHVLGEVGGSTPASSLHLSEAAFRLTAALECLLTGGDGGRSDLSRKVQQRAAVLVGAHDDDRLQVRNTVGAGYAARSAYVHGDREKASDLQALQGVVRRVLVHWVVQAAHCAQLSGRHAGRDGLVNLLDDALLSGRVHQEHIVGPRDSFRADGGIPPLPPLTRWTPDRFRVAGPGRSPLEVA